MNLCEFLYIQGADSVTGCVKVGGEVQVKSYYNIPEGKNNLKMRVRESQEKVTSNEFILTILLVRTSWTV